MPQGPETGTKFRRAKPVAKIGQDAGWRFEGQIHEAASPKRLIVSQNNCSMPEKVFHLGDVR
jgi:hypothetical protein